MLQRRALILSPLRFTKGVLPFSGKLSQPAANAIKVCKYIFFKSPVATSYVKFNSPKLEVSQVKTCMAYASLTTLVATSDIKDLLFTDLKMQVC